MFALALSAAISVEAPSVPKCSLPDRASPDYRQDQYYFDRSLELMRAAKAGATDKIATLVDPRIALESTSADTAFYMQGQGEVVEFVTRFIRSTRFRYSTARWMHATSVSDYSVEIDFSGEEFLQRVTFKFCGDRIVSVAAQNRTFKDGAL